MKLKTIFMILLLVFLLASCKISDTATNSPALSSEAATPPSAAQSASTTAALSPVSPADIPPKNVFTADYTGDGQNDTVEVYFYTFGEHKVGQNDADMVMHLPAYEGPAYNYVRFTAGEKTYTIELLPESNIMYENRVYWVQTGGKKPVLILESWHGRSGICVRAFRFDGEKGIVELPFPSMAADSGVFYAGYRAEVAFLDGFSVRVTCPETGFEGSVPFEPLYFPGHVDAGAFYEGDKARANAVLADGIEYAFIFSEKDENGNDFFLLRQRIHAGQMHAQYAFLQSFLTWDASDRLVMQKQELLPYADPDNDS